MNHFLIILKINRHKKLTENINIEEHFFFFRGAFLKLDLCIIYFTNNVPCVNK